MCISRIDFYFHSQFRANSPDMQEQIEFRNAETINKNIDPNQLHYIFSKSRKFEMEEIIDFISCLCQIS